MLWLIILLIGVIIFLVVSIIHIKRQIRGITRQLNDEPERKLTLTLLDRDLIALASAFNQAIGARKDVLLKNQEIQRQLKEDIANISHDLRTPLTSVQGYLQLLEKTPLGKMQREYLAISSKKVHELRKLITMFYELSYWNQVEVKPNFERININNFVAEQLLSMATELRSKNVTPEFSLEGACFICADRDMLGRVLQNLLDNALRYGEGYLKICIFPTEGNAIHIQIANAIDEDTALDVKRVFDRLYANDRLQGDIKSGLGLPISKNLVQKMGGSITAIIENQLFIVTLAFNLEP